MSIPSGPVPLGYGFRPFDEELIAHLNWKISGREENEEVIAEIEFYKFDPWELPAQSKIKNDDPQWFFFYSNQPKYSSGSRLNRATITGSWKPTGEHRAIRSMESGQERVIGSKKTLVFCQARESKLESACWTIHEYSANNLDSYVVCRLFKNQESKQRKKRKEAIECSNDARLAIESEVQLNQRTKEESSAQPADEVNSVASLNGMQEENDFMTDNFHTSEFLNPCKDNKEPIVGEAGASRARIRGESSRTSANVVTADVGAENNEEVHQNKIYNEEALKCHTETRSADSPPYLGDNLMASQTMSKCYAALPDLEETNADEKGRGPRESTCWTIHEYSSADNQNQEIKQRKKRKKAIECSNDTEHAIKSEVQLNQRTEDEFSAQPADDVNLVASHATIPEESNFTSANSETQAPIPIESQPADEVHSVASQTVIQRENTFMSVNLDGDDYAYELVDSFFNYDAASDCITEDQIPKADFDSVTFNSSSSYNLRTTPSETQLIRHAGGDDLQVINEFVSEASTSQYAETGITLRPRGTRVSASDPSPQHQGTAPRRILLPSRRPLDESCERIQQPNLGRSGFALVLVMSVLAIVCVGWLWFRG